MLRLALVTVLISLGVAACGESRLERGASGAGIGAAAGAATSGLTGGNVLGGALLGGAAGGAVGAITGKDGDNDDND
jgi:osmotically inducible lipoprotein OsmB